MTNFSDPRLGPVVDVAEFSPSCDVELVDIAALESDHDICVQSYHAGGAANLVGLRSFNELGEIEVTRMRVTDDGPSYVFDVAECVVLGAHRCVKATLGGIVTAQSPLSIVFRGLKGESRLKLALFWEPLESQVTKVTQLATEEEGA